MNLVEAITARVGTATRALICIDGPAGSGKTTLAEHLEAEHDELAVVHMDSLYAGWTNALSADLTQRLIEQIRDPFMSGNPVRYRRYDWYEGAFADHIEIGAPRLLVVEGVGAAQRAMRQHASVSVFLDVDPATGRARVLDRDGAISAAHIDDWQRQESAHFEQDGTRDGVDILHPARGTAPFGA